jgi:hypothetical protein
MVYQFACSQLTTVPFTVKRGLESVHAFVGRAPAHPQHDGRVRVVHTMPGKYGKPRHPNGPSSFLASTPKVLTARPVNSGLRAPGAFASATERVVKPIGPSSGHTDFLKQGYIERKVLQPIRY